VPVAKEDFKGLERTKSWDQPADLDFETGRPWHTGLAVAPPDETSVAGHITHTRPEGADQAVEKRYRELGYPLITPTQ